MNENDRDLILDLIEGRLAGPEAAAAQARIDASPALRAEMATQWAVRDALRSAEPPQMTVDEQTALHAALLEQLHLSPEPAMPVPVAARRSRWWVPVFGLATAAAVVVGFVALGPFGDSDDSGSTEVAASLAESSTADDGSTMQRGSEDADTTIGGADAPAAEVTTTMQAAAADQSAAVAEDELGGAEAGVTYAMDAGGEEAAVPEIAGDVPPAPELHADLSKANFSAQAVTNALEDDSIGNESVAMDDLVSCETALTGLAPENLVRVEPVASGTDDGNPVVVLLLEFADGEHITATIDLAACEVVDFAPPNS
jgi:hypothetical protein